MSFCDGRSGGTNSSRNFGRPDKEGLTGYADFRLTACSRAMTGGVARAMLV
jgi:hypothetical protein